MLYIIMYAVLLVNGLISADSTSYWIPQARDDGQALSLHPEQPHLVASPCTLTFFY